MCGIGGLWRGEGLEQPARSAAQFAAALAHRGPDGSGALVVPPAGPARLEAIAPGREFDGPAAGLLIHCRLSIIDLATGDQPMASRDRRFWIVFNGEIYNYPELREELLRSRDGRFATRSDTEVVLEVYREWGIAGFRRLNGIFGFALYDADAGELILARDPVGCKPLYWASRDGCLAFASEIRPLLASGIARRKLSPHGLAQYLFYRFVAAPHTVWADVSKVMPGHALRFNRAGQLVATQDYARPAPATASGGGNRAERLAPEFLATVQRQMLADVPVGAFLSGGLDSSMVVTGMRALDPHPRTFAVGFPDAPGRPGELHAAARAARVLGCHHEGLELEPNGYFGRLSQAIAQAEEPLAHPGMLLQLDLAAIAARELKVVLTGQGADEPLGGYPRHHAARVLPLLAGPLGALAKSRWLTGVAERREVLARIRRVLETSPGIERTAALFSPLRPQDAGALVRDCSADEGRAAILGALEPWWHRSADMDPVARVLYVDVRTSLAEDLLLVADKMGMAHGLEIRVPFLDLDYLDRIEAIPGTERVALFGSRKRIQHQLARRILPTALYDELRPSSSPLRRKRGFDVPVTSWFREVMGTRLEEYLVGPDSRIPAFLDAGKVRHMVRAWLGGSGEAFRMALALYVLETWLRNELD